MMLSFLETAANSGINDPGLQADAINIYPNPVKDNFTISLPEKGLSTLTF